MLEILAPAGNAACAKAAINNGANAIYLGYSQFSARQSAENFDEAALCAIVEYAHFCDVKVYVAMNTIVKNDETETFIKTLLSIWACGVDAVILQDVLLGKRIKEQYPKIQLHLSTQAGVCNLEGAKFAKECGFSRVILARETPLIEIKKIAAFIETETFVQGALCTCFSGQCYFSSFIGGNSGNRGRCKQPCRKQYVYDRKGNVEKNYALSLSDLCVGENIQKYIDAGVVSFKIEGRMRREEYVAAAVRYYRTLIDNNGDLKERLSDLKRTYNRGNYTGGLAFGQDKRLLSTVVQGHIGEKVGVVKVINGNFFVESTLKPQTGDAFKILREGKEIGGAVFAKTANKGFIISSKARLKNGDGVFITTDTAVNQRVLSTQKQGELSLRLHFYENERPFVECDGVIIEGEQALQSAQNRALTADELRICFSKTDGLPVAVHFDWIDLQGNIFIPKSELNAFRRKVYATLSDEITKNGHVAYEYRPFEVGVYSGKNRKTAVISGEFNGIVPDIAIYKPNEFNAHLPLAFINGTFEKYLYFPAYCTEKDMQALEERLKETQVDGLYVENYGGIGFAQKHGLRIFAGTGLNLTNDLSVQTFLRIDGATYYAVSKELNEVECKMLADERCFVLSSGDIKLMDLCYCPFGKTCSVCDKKQRYTLTDENGRAFPVRRYTGADGDCRFEIYNCANLISAGIPDCGMLLDLTVEENKTGAFEARKDIAKQKDIYKNHTSGNMKRGVL